MNQIKINGEIFSEMPTQGVARNFFWMVWSGSIGIVNSVVLWIFLARMRDVEELGRFTIVMGLYALFYNVCALGLYPSLVNEISRRAERSTDQAKTVASYVSGASIILFISGLACAVMMTALGFVVSGSSEVHSSAAILSLAILPTGLIHAAEATALSYGRTRLIAFLATLENVLRTIIPLALLLAGYSIWSICLSFAVIRFVVLAGYLMAASKLLDRFVIDRVELRNILRVTPTFAGTVIFAAINWQASILLLGYLSPEAESARFGVASRFLIPVAILMASYAGVIQPIISRYTERAPDERGSYLSRMSKYPLVLGTIAAIASPFLSRYVLTFLYGPAYAEAAPVLDILTLSVVPFCLVMVVSRGLVAEGAQRVDLLANAMGVVVTVCLGLLLIPDHGAKGAAIAQLSSYVLMALVEIAYMTQKVTDFRIWRTAALSSAAVAVLYIVIY